MDLGLYLMKYPFRKMIRFLLPYFRNSNPNNISWFLLLIGLITIFTYGYSLNQQSNIGLAVAIILCFCRMIVSTLDGLVAVEYNKSTVYGDVVNRMTPEVCDLFLYPTLVCSTNHHDPLGIGVITMSWAISYFGILGTASGCTVQSVGPAGQTDRLAALMVFSFLQIISNLSGKNVPFFDYFFYWILVGGSITLVLRIFRTFKAAKLKDTNDGKAHL